MRPIRGVLGLVLAASLAVGAPAPVHAATPAPTWAELQQVSPSGTVVEWAVADSVEGQLVVARVQRPESGSTCSVWVTRETATAAVPVAQQVPGTVSCIQRPTIGLSRNGSATLRIENRWASLRADGTWSPWHAAPTSSCGQEQIQEVIGLSTSRTAVITSCAPTDPYAMRHLRSRVFSDSVTSPSVHVLTKRACAGSMVTRWATAASGRVSLAWGCRYDPDVSTHASTIDLARFVPGEGWRAATVVADGLSSRSWYFPAAAGVTPSGSTTVVFAPAGYGNLKARRANADGALGSVYKIAPDRTSPGPGCPAYWASVQSSGRIDIRWNYTRAFSRPALNLPVDADAEFVDGGVECSHTYDIRLSTTGLLWRVTRDDLVAVRWQGQLQWAAPQDLFPHEPTAPAGDVIAISALGTDAHAYHLLDGTLFRRVGTLPPA